jgi:hypothetical protein
MTNNWIQRKTTSTKHGIQWSMFSQLKDLDFADDLAEFFTSRKQLQEKTTSLKYCAKQTVFKINTTKTTGWQ